MANGVDIFPSSQRRSPLSRWHQVQTNFELVIIRRLDDASWPRTNDVRLEQTPLEQNQAADPLQSREVPKKTNSPHLELPLPWCHSNPEWGNPGLRKKRVTTLIPLLYPLASLLSSNIIGTLTSTRKTLKPRALLLHNIHVSLTPPSPTLLFLDPKQSLGELLRDSEPLNIEEIFPPRRSKTHSTVKPCPWSSLLIQ